MSNGPIVLWFRNDLRLRDHPALSAAVKSGAPILPLFVFDEHAAGRWAPGGASRWWLGKSLEVLGRDIAELGGRLILRRGDTTKVLHEIVAASGACAIYFTRGYEPWSVELECQLHKTFDGAGIAFRRFGGRLLREPEELRTASGGAYQVFTPFWRAFRRDFTAPKTAGVPRRLDVADRRISSDHLSDWGLFPTKPDWSGGLVDNWQPGERGARARLNAFIDGAVSDYATERDRLDHDGTSRLSPHLAFGEISPAACWRAASDALGRRGISERSVETFLKELAWREFSHALLVQYPEMPEAPLRAEFSALRWAKSSAHLEAWQRGMTGYPVVDAGMRELWATGYMHNRARMIVASFLTKHLLLPWSHGEAWFWDTLVDADLANNSANWQWVAGCGADAAPYFRVFNPVLQGEKFDPQGDYVRHWIPELRRLKSPDIHKPWTADAAALQDARVSIGGNYPAPIVDHKAARERALAAFKHIKTTEG